MSVSEASGRPCLQWPRPPRRRRCLRVHVRGARARRLRVRLVERDRGEGADRLQAPRRRRDRPGARDPRLRDLLVMFMLGFAAAGGGVPSETLVSWRRRSRSSPRGSPRRAGSPKPIDRLLDRLPLEYFLLAVFGFLIGWRGSLDELGLSEAIGALVAGIILSETTVRDQIEERFFSFHLRGPFTSPSGCPLTARRCSDVGWSIAIAVVLTLFGSSAAGSSPAPRALHAPAELQRRRGSRGPRRVHDHPGQLRLRQPRS